MSDYKFPDEKEVDIPSDDTDLKVEIVDDAPPEDKGRKPLPKEMVDELERDDLEDYSDKVKKRISQARKAFHDERRAKEEATREREEAIRFAQAQMEENKRLKQQVGFGQKLYVQEATKSAEGELATAKAKLKEAFEAGNSEELANAQEALADAKFKIKEYERYKPSLQEPETPVQNTQQAQAPRVDSKAEAWRQKNTWFGADTEMTALALGLHEKLVRSGIDPSSDDYYEKIDSSIRRRFPENFGDENSEMERPTPRSKANSVVAPVTRSSAPRQVRLTASAVALAKRLGISPEQYAREVMKLENNNG
jgi:hypothetical protein